MHEHQQAVGRSRNMEGALTAKMEAGFDTMEAGASALPLRRSWGDGQLPTPLQAYQLQRNIGNRAVAQLFQAAQRFPAREQRLKEPQSVRRKPRLPAPGAARPALSLAGTAGSVLQAVWMKHKESELLRWDELVNGLRWYMDTEEDTLFYQIEKKPEGSESDIEQLEQLEGKSHAQSLKDWCESGMFAESKEAPQPAEESEETLGPVTQSGVPIPRVGFGTDGIGALTEEQKKLKLGPEAEQSLKQANAETIIGEALATGYRLFDTAESYGTLGAVGNELKKAAEQELLTGDDIFIVYKIKPKEVIEKYNGDLGEAVKNALTQLKIKSAIDVLMLHEMPAPQHMSFFTKQMQSLVSSGLVRYLGASNVPVSQFQDVASHGDSSMGVSFIQNKFHPMRQDKEVLEKSKQSNVTYMGYNILGSGSSTGTCKTAQIAQEMQEQAYDVREDPKMEGLRQEEGFESSPQMALAWAVQKGTVQVPSTKNKGRMLENFRARYMPVSEKAMQSIEEFVANMDNSEAAGWLEDGTEAGGFKFALFMEAGIKERKFYEKLDGLLAVPGIAAGLLKLAGGIKLSELVEPLKALIGYVNLIDSGFYKELGEFMTREPEDYDGIEKAFKQQGPGMLLTWYKHQDNDVLNLHGCKDAQHEAMIQAGESANYKNWLEAQELREQQKSAVVKVPAAQGAQMEVSKQDLDGDYDVLGWSWKDDPLVPDDKTEVRGIMNGKGIQFIFVEDKGATIVIRKTGEFEKTW